MSYAPCKGCEDRIIGCHSKCKKFEKFKRENDLIKQRRHAEEIRRSCEWRKR